MFDVKKYLIKVAGGRQYLPVSARLIWFREQHPDWGVDTRPVAIDVEKRYAIFEASVFNADGKLMAKGTKMENIHGFADYIEKAETGAIGRALAVCGFGTQFAPDLDEIVQEPATNGVPAHPAVTGHDQLRDGAPSSRTIGYDSRPLVVDNRSLHTGGRGGADRDGAERFDEPRFECSSSAGELEQDAVAGSSSCDACGIALKTSQIALSMRKYGLSLCPECQKKRRAAEAG